MNNIKNVPEIRFKGCYDEDGNWIAFNDRWTSYKLSDIFDKVESGNRLPKAMLIDGEIPYVVACTTNNGVAQYISDKQTDFNGNEMKLFEENSITFSIDNPEAIFIQDVPFYTSNIMRVLHRSDLSKSQLHYFLEKIRLLVTYFNWSFKFSGPVVMNSTIYIPVNDIGFDYNMIEKIGAYFSKLDEIIGLQESKIEAYKQLKKCMLQKMFPKDGRDIPEIRFKGCYDEDGNWIAFTHPWEQRKLSDIAVLTSSKRVHAEDYVETGVPFYRGKEISELKEHKPISEVLYITEYKYNEISSMYGSPKEGDLLITAVGTLGNTWVIDQTPFYFKDGNLIWFKDIKSNPKYLDYAMSTADGQKKILASAIGSNQKALTMVKLNELEFMFPGKTEQDKIAEYFSYLDNLITLHQCKCDIYKKLKKCMLQKMLV